MIAFRYLLCVGSGGAAGGAFEYIVKIGLGRETALIANLRQGHVGGHQQVHGFFDSLLLNILVCGLSGRGFEKTRFDRT